MWMWVPPSAVELAPAWEWDKAYKAVAVIRLPSYLPGRFQLSSRRRDCASRWELPNPSRRYPGSSWGHPCDCVGGLGLLSNCRRDVARRLDRPIRSRHQPGALFTSRTRLASGLRLLLACLPLGYLWRRWRLWIREIGGMTTSRQGKCFWKMDANGKRANKILDASRASKTIREQGVVSILLQVRGGTRGDWAGFNSINEKQTVKKCFDQEQFFIIASLFLLTSEILYYSAKSSKF